MTDYTEGEDGSSSYTTIVLHYIYHADAALNMAFMREKTKQYLCPSLRSKAMSLAEILTQEGELRGEVKGEHKTMRRVVQSMLSKGQNTQMVANLLELSPTEVQKLARELEVV